MTNFTFFDVETPNSANDSICSIGVIRSNKNGAIEYKNNFLINPCCRFDQINISIHGIQESDVKHAPDFYDVWKNELSEVFFDSVLSAHNALFDIRVLEKTLRRCGVIIPHETSYLDTATLARNQFPDINNYKLPTVCSYLNIPLENHHNAMDDAYAAFRIYTETLKRFEQLQLPIKKIGQFNNKTTPSIARRRISPDSTIAMKNLIDQIRMMESDGVIAFEEADFLRTWLKDNVQSIPHAIYKRLDSILDDVLEDGAITPIEEMELHDLFIKLIYPTEGNSCDGIKGRVFCLTGDFNFGSKSDVIDAIENQGGTCVKDTTKKCDYVVIGKQGSDRYAFGKYGKKVEKAVKYQSEGCPIQVINEDDLIKML